MAYLIDKDALVAEIESNKKYAQTLGDNAINSSMQQFYDGMKQGYVSLLSFLDTLEVKEAQEEQVSEEFEKAFQLICNELGVSYSCKAALKSDANELLSIARKQIASEIDVDAMVEDNILCDNAVETPTPYRINERAYYRQGIEDTLKTIKGE